MKIININHNTYILKFQNLWNKLNTPYYDVKGIYSFTDFKFYIVMLLYLSSFIIFAHDDFFKSNSCFEFHQGIIVLIFSTIISITLNWDLCLFGNPHGANLLLQLLQILPFSLFIARIVGISNVTYQHVDNNLNHFYLRALKKISGIVIENLKALIEPITAIFPAWFIDIFANFQISVLLIIILFCLSFRSLKIKVSSICSILFIAFISVLVSKTGPCKEFFLLGTLLLGSGMALQFSRYDLCLYDLNVIHKLDAYHCYNELISACIRNVMNHLKEHSEIDSNSFKEIIRGIYNNKVETEQIDSIAKYILTQMVNTYNLVTVKWGNGQILIQANKQLWENESLLKQIAIFPRIVLLLCITLIWIIFPLDPIPDIIPCLGMLDDVAITVLSGSVLKDYISEHMTHKLEKT